MAKKHPIWMMLGKSRRFRKETVWGSFQKVREYAKTYGHTVKSGPGFVTLLDVIADECERAMGAKGRKYDITYWRSKDGKDDPQCA